MDGNQFDRVSRAFATWLSRRRVLQGLGGLAAGGAVLKGGSMRAQNALPPDDGAVTVDAAQEPPPVETPTEPSDLSAGQDGSYTDTPTPTDASWEPTPTDESWEPTPTDTPWATETPTETPWATETPTETPFPTETPTEPPPPPDNNPPIINSNDPRPLIVDLCQRAASVLEEDVADPDAFERHPHPGQAYGFLDSLYRVAQQGFNAETWDDDRLADYTIAADTIALAVRIGADAFYETLTERRRERQDADPDTCMYKELAKWTSQIDACDADDFLCRMTAFWDFTVLKSCRRCLRSFQ